MTGLLEGGFGVAADLAMPLVKKLIAGFEGRLEAYQWEWLLEDIDRIRAATEELKSRRPVTAGEVAAVLTAAQRVAKKTSESNKRRLLQNAVVNAFDEALYEEGLTLRLLHLLEDLQYGDVHFLRERKDKPETLGPSGVTAGADWSRSLQAHHAVVLFRHGLITAVIRDQDQWVPDHTFTEQHIFRGFGMVERTALGNRLLRLVEEPTAAPSKGR